MKKKFTTKPSNITAATKEELDLDMAVYRAVTNLYDAIKEVRNTSDIDELIPKVSDVRYALTALDAKIAIYKDYYSAKS